MSLATLAASGPMTFGYSQAFAMMEEFERIRSVFGDDCLTFVKKALLASPTPQWEDVVFGAVSHWQQTHPRFDPDGIWA